MSGSSPWNTSGFAFAPSTNTMDAQGMPSSQAQDARDKTADIMAAVKAGDMDKANALMGKDTTGGKILPGVGWMKRKLNKTGKQPGLHGEVVEVEKVDEVGVEKTRESKGDGVIR